MNRGFAPLFGAAFRHVRALPALAILASLTSASVPMVASQTASSQTASTSDRKAPMRFDWNVQGPASACEPRCARWVSAVGSITADTVAAFQTFAKTRDLHGALMVLDSSGGSVVDAIRLGRIWRDLGVVTTVGMTLPLDAGEYEPPRATLEPATRCESMCAFLLLSGTRRYVDPASRVRVHQIWMGDRAADARGASYTADDVMIIQRDIGSLAKYTFEMGGTGELLSIALGVPPWEPLRELTPDEARRAGLTSVASLADLVSAPPSPAMVSATPPEGRLTGKLMGGFASKPIQDRVRADMRRTADALPHGDAR